MGVFIDQKSINVSFTDANFSTTTSTTTTQPTTTPHSTRVENLDENTNIVLMIDINHLYLESIDLENDLSIIRNKIELDFKDYLTFSKHQYGDVYLSFDAVSAGYDNGYDVDIKLAIVFDKLGKSNLGTYFTGLN